MKKLIIIAFLLSLLKGYSQEKQFVKSIRPIKWKVDISYLPGPYSAVEKYKYSKLGLNHNYYQLRYRCGINWRKPKFSGKKNKVNVIKAVDYVFKHKEDANFVIDISRKDSAAISALISTNQYFEKNYNITTNDVKKYLIKDSITINIKEFNTEYSKYYGSYALILDGAPFSISLTANAKDTIQFQYSANLSGGVDDEMVDEFLIYYHIVNEYNLFLKAQLKRHFSKNNLYDILIRYIAYLENKIDRSNYEKY